MNVYEGRVHRRLIQKYPRGLDHIAPSVEVAAVIGGKKQLHLKYGKRYKYFDLASLTKIIFTTQAFMKLHDSAPSLISKKVNDILFWWEGGDIPIKNLLNHTSGLPWWAPFYKRLEGPLDPRHRWVQMKAELQKLKVKKNKKAIYSDPDFLFLGAILEEIYQEDLLKIWQQMKAQAQWKNLFFNANNVPRGLRSDYAPTENCPWRKKVLQGEVHDDNTWALGGVSSHAGLFGTMNGVIQYGLSLRNSLLGKGRTLGVTQKTIKKFMRRAYPSHIGDFGLGFMKPSPGKSSCGKYFRPVSFGHLGFTGTSFWMDPSRDLFVIILSNRVHPNRDNIEIRQLRPLVHDFIVEEYMRS